MSKFWDYQEEKTTGKKGWNYQATLFFIILTTRLKYSIEILAKWMHTKTHTHTYTPRIWLWSDRTSSKMGIRYKFDKVPSCNRKIDN